MSVYCRCGAEMDRRRYASPKMLYEARAIGLKTYKFLLETPPAGWLVHCPKRRWWNFWRHDPYGIEWGEGVV